MQRYARLGADRDDIVTALGIPKDALADAEVVGQLQAEIARGHARSRIDDLRDRRKLARGGDGSVNAVLAGLRHRLGWDRPGHGKTAARPDDDAAIAELVRVASRYRAPR